MRLMILTIALAALCGCGSLERRAVSINAGDDKSRVLAAMGSPGDRQIRIGRRCQDVLVGHVRRNPQVALPAVVENHRVSVLSDSGRIDIGRALNVRPGLIGEQLPLDQRAAVIVKKL